MSIAIPAFGETAFQTNRSDRNSVVTVISQAECSAFSAYVDLFSADGYAEKERYTTGSHSFAAFQKGTQGVFLNYFGGARELYVLCEENCTYFDCRDEKLPAIVPPQITQVHLEDFGMSYAIRLSDGRFILMDGGRENERDTDRLYEVLKAGSPFEKPVVAAWILTHAHSDHFFAFMTFAEKYGDRVSIEKVMYNFPEYDDFDHYPVMTRVDPRFTRNTSPTYNIPLMFAAADKLGCELYTLRTGQIYRIGDAVCEVLACMDDTIHRAKNMNATSTVVRIELGGQVSLWPADMTVSDALLNEKYGNYLKCDIMQVPHHGFMSGIPSVLIDFYRLAKPDVCLLPASRLTAYSTFSTYMEATDFLFRSAGVKEMIDGDVTRTITLPYTADENGARDLELAYLRGRDDGGALCWVFSDLCSEEEEDTCFTVLNVASRDAVLHINVYCEDKTQDVRHIKAIVPGGQMTKLRIFDMEQVDGDSEFYNFSSLKKQGKPKDMQFCVRVRSSIPVVVSNKNHMATYHSINR